MDTPTLRRHLAPITLAAGAPGATFTNWGLSFTCRPEATFVPRDEGECALVLELARREGKRVRAAGVGHSPSDVACTREYMVRTDRLDKVVQIDADKRFVVAQAGITLNALHAALAAHGLAMINLGSISDQSLAGVVTTATHGTGIAHPVLSMYVRALTLLLADGSRVRCSRECDPDLFMASICGLGSTGLILDITLDVQPAFRLIERQESRPFDDFLENMRSLVHADKFVRFWWFPQADTVRVSSFHETTEPRKPLNSWLWHSLVGFHLLQLVLFLGRYLSVFNTWYGQISAWLISPPTVAVDDSWRIFNLDCKYPQYTTEWAIPYERTEACLRELRAWLDHEIRGPGGLRPHCLLEIRFTDADDIWLSPGNGQRMCWIGIVQYKPYGLNVPYRALFAAFERILLAHAGKPHWAKAHPLRPSDLRALYPRFDDFVRVVKRVDPRGCFRNPYVDRHIFGVEEEGCGARVFKARK